VGLSLFLLIAAFLSLLFYLYLHIFHKVKLNVDIVHLLIIATLFFAALLSLQAIAKGFFYIYAFFA